MGHFVPLPSNIPPRDRGEEPVAFGLPEPCLKSPPLPGMTTINVVGRCSVRENGQSKGEHSCDTCSIAIRWDGSGPADSSCFAWRWERHSSFTAGRNCRTLGLDGTRGARAEHHPGPQQGAGRVWRRHGLDRRAPHPPRLAGHRDQHDRRAGPRSLAAPRSVREQVGRTNGSRTGRRLPRLHHTCFFCWDRDDSLWMPWCSARPLRQSPSGRGNHCALLDYNQEASSTKHDAPRAGNLLTRLLASTPIAEIAVRQSITNLLHGSNPAVTRPPAIQRTMPRVASIPWFLKAAVINTPSTSRLPTLFTASSPHARYHRGHRPNILLSSVFGPYAQDDEYGSRLRNPMELYHNQVTRVQGPFSLRLFHRSWGLMLIQANLDAPCTLLDFPTLDRFIEELRSRRYDIVGISGIVPNFLKVKKMCELVRAAPSRGPNHRRGTCRQHSRPGQPDRRRPRGPRRRGPLVSRLSG